MALNLKKWKPRSEMHGSEMHGSEMLHIRYFNYEINVFQII